MSVRPTILRSRIVSTGRNIVRGETHDSRTYLTRYGERVVVKTIMELEVVRRKRI